MKPVRTCVGCRVETGKAALIRVVRRADGGTAVDRTGKAPGRGAYLHADADCIGTARKRRALERALKSPIAPELWTELARSAAQAR